MTNVSNRKFKLWYNKLPVPKREQVVYKLYDLSQKRLEEVSE